MAVAVRTLTFRDAINEALGQEMERDPRVVLMGEDVAGGATLPGFEREDAWGGVLGVTKGLVQRFGRERVLDTPISESAFIGAAVGAAATGLRPVAELMFVDFFGVCMDQIFNQGAKLRYMFGGKAAVPMVIRTMIGAGFRAAGQHSGCHYSVFTHMPGLKCVVPSTPADAKGLLAASIRDDDPVLFFEHKMLYDLAGEVPEGELVIPLGQADVKRSGDTVTVVAIGRMVHLALEAADRLSAEGISVEVVGPPHPARRGGGRGQSALLDGRRHRGRRRFAGVRRPGRTAADGDRTAHPRAVLAPAGGLLRPQHRPRR